MSEAIGLAAFIDEVKRELMKPATHQTDKLLMIEEVELQIQIGFSRQGTAGLKVYVVELGANAKRDDTHTVKVKLQPLLTHQERIEELKRDPNWAAYAQASVNHTVKGGDAPSQRFD